VEVRIPAVTIEGIQTPQPTNHLILVFKNPAVSWRQSAGPSEVLAATLLRVGVEIHYVRCRELPAIESLDQDATAFKDESDGVNVVLVHGRGFRDNYGGLFVADWPIGILKLVLEAAGSTNHQSEAGHRHIDFHPLLGAIPLIGADDVHENGRLHLSVDEAIGIPIFNILLTQLMRKLDKLLETVGDMNDGVLDGSLRIVDLQDELRLFLDLVYLIVLLASHLEFVNHVLEVDHAFDKADVVLLVPGDEHALDVVVHLLPLLAHLTEGRGSAYHFQGALDE